MPRRRRAAPTARATRALLAQGLEEAHRGQYRALIAGSFLGGIKAVNGGTVHSRGNNAGEQVAPPSGTALVPGF